MHLSKLFLFLTLLFSIPVRGQKTSFTQKLNDKTLLSPQLEYMEFINDTTLYSSINSYKDTAVFFLRNDTLFIKQEYLQTDRTGTKYIDKIYDYKIIMLSTDTLKLLNNYRLKGKPDDWEDTLVFINIENIKEPTKEFKHLKLDVSGPWSGFRHIDIDKEGNVKFSFKPVTKEFRLDENKIEKPKTISGRFTTKEFQKFKDLLSKAMVSKLPLKRGCPIDGSNSNFEIMIGQNIYKSTGCYLKWTQHFLLNYLYDLGDNHNLIHLKK